MDCTWINKVIILCERVISLADLYKLTDEVLGQGAYAKVQGCISLQNGQEFAVKVGVIVSLGSF